MPRSLDLHSKGKGARGGAGGKRSHGARGGFGDSEGFGDSLPAAPGEGLVNPSGERAVVRAPGS